MAGSKNSLYYDVFLKYKIWLSTNDNKNIIGEGMLCLLDEINRLGSLKAASDKMKISYRKAWGNLKETEEIIGFKLITKTRGGISGGKSELTSEAKELLIAYNELKKDFDLAIKNITKKFFNKINQPK